MGKWNTRYYYAGPRRPNYQDYQWSPPTDEPCPHPQTEVWQDNVPMWEKTFCYLVGRMPWKKVLSTKNFMHCHSNVLTWDDSAGEEAFVNAKKRFWDEFNGLPCETRLPNPDMYVDEINWNPYIDPELARELDKEYFHPDDKYYLPCSSKGNNVCHEDTDNPWEPRHTENCTGQDKTTGLTKNNNPWESHHTQETEIKDNSWGGACNNSWDVKRNADTWNSERYKWQDRGACSRNWNQNSRESSKPNYQSNNYRAHEFGSHLGSKVPNGRGSPRGQQWRDNYNCESRGSGNVYRGRARYTSGCRKREGSDYEAVNCEEPRIQGGDYQSSRAGNADNNKRVSFGGQWS